MEFVKSSLSLVMVLFLTAGCGSNDKEEQKLTNKSDNGILSNKVHEQNIQARLYLPKSKFPDSVKSIPFIIENSGGSTLTFGVEYHVEKYKNGNWYAVPFKPDVGFVMIARLLKPGQVYKDQVSIDLLDYRLTKGRYRVVKKIGSNGTNKTLGAEFQITD